MPANTRCYGYEKFDLTWYLYMEYNSSKHIMTCWREYMPDQEFD